MSKRAISAGSFVSDFEGFVPPRLRFTVFCGPLFVGHMVDVAEHAEWFAKQHPMASWHDFLAYIKPTTHSDFPLSGPDLNEWEVSQLNGRHILFGLVEAFAQSDQVPPAFRESSDHCTFRLENAW